MQTKYFFMYLRYCPLFVLLTAGPARSQVGLKALNAADYHLWGELDLQELSQDGKWVSYRMGYQDADTLFVKSTKGEVIHALPGHTQGAFLTADVFCARGRTGLALIDLRAGKIETLANITQYFFDTRSKCLFLLRDVQQGQKELITYRPFAEGPRQVAQVTGYAYNNATGKMAYCTAEGTGSSIYTLSDATGSARLLLKCQDRVSALTWQENGAHIAFLKFSEGSAVAYAIGYSSYDGRQNYSLDLKTDNRIPDGYAFFMNTYRKFEISGDGSLVLFKVYNPQRQTANPQSPQVWNAGDLQLYTVPLGQDGMVRQDIIACWAPKQGILRCLTSPGLQTAAFTGSAQHVILSDPGRYQPQERYYPDTDFYIESLPTGQRQLLLEKFSSNPQLLHPSPEGNYIAYFKDRGWWLYDIRKAVHKNLTAALPAAFDHEGWDKPGPAMPYGIVGWLEKDAGILVYDQYDLWLLYTNGQNPMRVSHGREKLEEYRVVVTRGLTPPHITFDNALLPVVDLKNGLLFKTRQQGQESAVILDADSKVLEKVTSVKHIRHLTRAQDGSTIAYTLEDFQTPTSLYSKQRNIKPMLTFQSNPHYKDYRWGYAEQISYSAMGHALKGALFYPPGFSEAGKYPMIVYVYEKLSDSYNKYTNPSMDNPVGFNVSNLTAQGYVVLMPDIVYSVGSPGKSATACIMAATDAILEKGFIAPGKIGLIGQSFGGYQTNFTISQTNRFAAAVSGLAINDYLSGYLSVEWNYGIPNFFQYEHDQLRMGTPPFGHFNTYMENSPLYHAEKINTPLLSWSGADDVHVNVSQSYEFFLAMRRLGKEHQLIIYPGERHSINNTQHRYHLTASIEGWFGYYLQGHPKPEWALKNRPR